MTGPGMENGAAVQLVMQLAGQQLLAKLLDDVLASLTPEQKAECANALTTSFLLRLKKGEQDWDVREFVNKALQRMVDQALVPLKPDIEAAAKKALATGVVERSGQTVSLIDDAIQRKVNHCLEELRRELSGVGRR